MANAAPARRQIRTQPQGRHLRALRGAEGRRAGAARQAGTAAGRARVDLRNVENLWEMTEIDGICRIVF